MSGKAMRYTAYFLECNCAVLLHDSLWSPSKHPHHLEYVQSALDCLGLMVQDAPATLAQDSLQQILKAVEKAIAHQNSPAASTPGMAGNLTSQFPCLPHTHDANSTDQHIHLTDLWDQSHATGGNPTLSGEQNMHEFDFDVMTTDLLHFFGPSSEGNPTGNPS